MPYLNALPDRLRNASTNPVVLVAANVIEEMCADHDIPLDEVLETVAYHAASACGLLYPANAEQPAPRIWLARCRHCSVPIRQHEGQSWWEDDRGITRCMKVPIDEIGRTPSVPGHEPMPAGLAGEPVEQQP